MNQMRRKPAETRLDVISEPEVLSTLAEEWDALLLDSEAASPFLGSTWIRTWWEVFGADRRLYVLVAREEDGTLLGLAPLMVQRGVEGCRPRSRVLLFIGQQGETLAERLDVIVRKGDEKRVVAAFVEHLLATQRALFDVLFLERVRAESSTLALLRQGLLAHGLKVRTENEQPSPYLPLPASYEALQSGMSRNFRRQLKNASNRLAKEGAVRISFAPTDLPVAEGMETLIELHRARWGPEEGSFRTQDYKAFHRLLSQRLADREELVLAFLTVDGEHVAGRYDFLYDERIWCFQGGWRPGHERMRVGTILTAEVLRWAIDQGCREYDFLSGAEAYKSRWSKAERTLVDLRAWGHGPRAWADFQLGRARAWARRLLRRG